jgi:hypothetical protein
MILCDFSYTPDGDRFQATCTVCGRQVRTKTTKAVAACRSEPKKPTQRQLLQAAGVAVAKPPITKGPGAELKKLLAKIGIHAAPGCSCNQRAAMMDARGVAWCEANTDEIVGWLREEATKRGLPFVDIAGRLLVRRAIANARRLSS